ncbi:hypothetical protein PspS04_17525 [Pseudomonas sp. S04]|uniref:DUF4123 domain-containing protein n=1 Tax=unclassified Pseudomonas TaxID=196821 RepID=UPI00131FAEAF|nr:MULTISPECIES: DUF4123 domain-containing protein [unclassified Pseudomonas]QHD02051.1 hypothetical protein PspS04_17525 [Pseudomonas sp. S04]QHF34534.1 hypothetical protein PspS19_17530 [Pseudomonas sp. S19]
MSLSTSLPGGLPWDEQQACLLLDGATISDLPTRVKQLSPAASTFALYDQPPFSALRDISPLLVAIQRPDDPLAQFYLQHAHEEWGVLLFSAAPVFSVAEHLRKLVTIEMPAGPAALLRLADAAVAQALFASADQCLFGPLSCVVTADSVNAVWQCQRPRQAQCPALAVPYRLSHEQDAALQQVDRRRTLLELDAHLRRHFPEFHPGLSVAQRWPMLERCETQACALGLSSQSELFHYANVMTWLDGSDVDQHPRIHHMLHTPSLQSPGERVALAADLACQWAFERGLS